MRFVNQTYAVRPIGSVKRHPRNANEGNLEKISESVDENGFYGAVYVQRSTQLIVAGNHRHLVAEQSGATEIPVIELDIDDATATKILLADNATRDAASTNSAKLAALLNEAMASPTRLRGTGHGEATLSKLLKEIETKRRREDDDGESDGSRGPALSAPIVQRVKAGDLWLLGRHRLLCGDSFVEADRARLLDGEADAVVTDPPYAIYGSSTGIGADIADDKMVRPFFEQLFRVCRASVKTFGHVYVCCDWRSWAAVWDSARRAQLAGKNCVVWNKSGGLGNMYANCHEFVGFFVKDPPDRSMKNGKETGQRTVPRPNIITIPRVSGDERVHNAQKPEELIAELVTNATDTGGVVVDFFGGSGTTLAVCERLGRAARVFEIEPRECDKILARWERITGNVAVLAPSAPEEPRALAEGAQA